LSHFGIWVTKGGGHIPYQCIFVCRLASCAMCNYSGWRHPALPDAPKLRRLARRPLSARHRPCHKHLKNRKRNLFCTNLGVHAPSKKKFFRESENLFSEKKNGTPLQTFVCEEKISEEQKIFLTSKFFLHTQSFQTPLAHFHFQTHRFFHFFFPEISTPVTCRM
jgi:hypothetical protein